MINSEDDFQKWVMARFEAMADSHVLDLSMMQNDVPDLNVAMASYRKERWLELKFQHFGLKHDKYDDFYWKTLQRAQIEWLRLREKTGSRCGILGYAFMVGDHSSTPYLVFHTPEQYLDRIWRMRGTGRGPSSGSIILSHQSIAAHSIKTGPDLLRFLDAASEDRPYNGA